MHIDFTGRHVEVTPALRQFTEDKLHKLERLLDGPLEIHVVLAVEKHRHLVEIQVKSRTTVLASAHETDDLYASIAEVADRLERQALKHKEKLSDHKHRKGPRDAALAPSRESVPASAVAGASYRAKPLSPEEALAELEASGDDLLVFRDPHGDRVCVLHRQRDGSVVLVEPEA